jgi:hypothetical protein
LIHGVIIGRRPMRLFPAASESKGNEITRLRTARILMVRAAQGAGRWMGFASGRADQAGLKPIYIKRSAAKISP